MNIDDLKAVAKDQIQATAEKLDSASVAFLVDELCEKDDKLRYKLFCFCRRIPESSPLFMLTGLFRQVSLTVIIRISAVWALCCLRRTCVGTKKAD
jgi:hypothetical protein